MDNLTEDFLQGLKDVEKTLLTMQFKQYSFIEKGPAYFISYRKEKAELKFLFGPPEFEVEVIIYTPKVKFAFKDLLQMHSIKTWVNNNRYVPPTKRNIKNEIQWFVSLIKFSLPIIQESL